MNENGKALDELRDEKWLWDLALLYDVIWHLNDVNTKLQVQQTLFSDMFQAIKCIKNEIETILGTAGKY